MSNDLLTRLEQMVLSGDHDSPDNQLDDIAGRSSRHALIVEVETAIATSLPLFSYLDPLRSALEDGADDALASRLRILHAICLAGGGRTAAGRSELLDLLHETEASPHIRYRTLRELARLCMEDGDMDEALALFMRAISTARGLDDRFRQDIILFDIARGYQHRGRNNSALEILTGLKTAFPARSFAGARLATYRARSALDLGEWDEARPDLEAARTFFETNAPRSDYAVLTLVEQARMLAGQKQIDEALAELDRAAALSEALDNEGLFARTSLTRGELLLDDGKLDTAIESLIEAYSYFDDVEAPAYHIAAARALGRAYHAERNMALAEKFYSIALAQARRKKLSKLSHAIRAVMASLSIEESAVHTSRPLLSGRQSGVSGYVLGKKLGTGGFGTVYRAYDTDRDKVVAIKLIGLSRLYETAARATLRKSLATEYEAASRVCHPGCVRIHAYGDTPEGDVFVVQDFIAGAGLDTFLENDWTLRAKREALIGIAEAISALHRAGVIHRDLKPENILMHNGKNPVLIDFGIAKLKEQDAAFRGFGSIRYMAPEQLAGKVTDEAADWFAFGVLALEWLGGSAPLDIDTSRSAPRRKTKSLRQFLKQSDCPEALAKRLYPLLEKNPQRRLRDAAEIIARLSHA